MYVYVCMYTYMYMYMYVFIYGVIIIIININFHYSISPTLLTFNRLYSSHIIVFIAINNTINLKIVKDIFYEIVEI